MEGVELECHEATGDFLPTFGAGLVHPINAFWFSRTMSFFSLINPPITYRE